MKELYVNKVKDYFRDKAEDYDLVEEQLYWVLSDKLLWMILKDNVLSKICEPICFIDAGAGTARWSLKILEEYADSSGWLIDLSSEMLAQAKCKLINKGFLSRVVITQDNLDTMSIPTSQKYNLAISFHNVLGFVDNPAKVIKKISEALSPDGYFVCVVPNFFHNIFFNIYVRNLDLAEYCVETHKGKFTDNMPEMHMFTPNGLSKIYTDAGLIINGLYGFPIAIYPGMQETQLKGQSNKLQDILSDQQAFERIFNLESRIYKDSQAAARGNNLIIIGQKK